MNYGIYRRLRNSTWKCLLDFEIDKLPVDIMKIAKAAGVRIVENSTVNELNEGEYGRSYYDGQTWVIIFDDSQDIVISRFTIAHELGHFFLGHALTHAKYADVQQVSRKPRAEQQADMFALRLLCPACIIKDLDVSSADDIAELCRIPKSWAKVRYDRMKELEGRNKFFTDPLEEKVYNNFSEYLASHSSKKS